MKIEDKSDSSSAKRFEQTYGDSRAYYNWGVNGSSKSKTGEGSASLYALRPGWHFGDLPSMRQIGYASDSGAKDMRLDNQVWVEVEMSADVDYNEEARSNYNGDIPTHIPTDGYYEFATNPTQKKTKSGETANDKSKGNWYVSGAFKIVRPLGDVEARQIIDDYNAENNTNVPYDYERANGRVFNADTMTLEDSNASEDNGVKVMKDGSATKYSLSTWTPETQTKVRNNLVKAGHEVDVVDKWISDVNSVASVIAANKDRLDFEAADNQTMLKNNQEYVKTLDASTLCAKRLVYQGTFDAIQHRLPNTVLTSDDLIELSNMMKEHGVEAPCSVCYVESRRRHLGKFAQDWLNGYDGEYKPNLDEVTTSDGLEALRHSHPQTYKDFVDAMNKKGSSNPKVVQLRTEYRNEIMKLTPSQIKKIEAIGGLRVQSFSDFETPHLLDMMQSVMDMSAKGLTSQAYTKVPNFAWVFGNTGIKINLSLIAEGDGFDADGNLAFSSTEGMDIKDAMELRDAYSDNVGTIIVGANDKHILACMSDDRIDYIIPFHRSGWGQNELKLMGLDSYKDYTYGQKEHDLETGKGLENLYPPDYWDYNLSGKENAERYLNLCARTGREPKFSEFLVNNGDGSYSLQPDGSTDGYWKTLIDFKMYDNNGKGVAQQKVQPNFNMEEAYRVLNEYEGGANSLPVANEIVEKFVAKYKDENLVPVNNDIKYSLSQDTEANNDYTIAPTFYSHMGKVVDDIKQNKLGANSVVNYLKGKGVKDEEIKWSGIEAFLDGKKSVTKEELQEFVQGSQLEIEEVSLTQNKNSEAYKEFKRMWRRYIDGSISDEEFDLSLRDSDISDTEAYLRNEYEEYDSITEEQLNEMLDLLGKVYESKVFDNKTKWHDYKIEGGENYRELLFKIPNSDYSNPSMRTHWSQSGVLAHARMQDVQTKDSKNMLFIEEIQSDWHNEGQKKEYRESSSYSEKEYNELSLSMEKSISDLANKIKNDLFDYHGSRMFIRDNVYASQSVWELNVNNFLKNNDGLSSLFGMNLNDYIKEIEELRRVKNKLDDLETERRKVPNAPFKNNYHEYVLKRLLRMAAEEGYDSIGWTPADIQADRWSPEYMEGYRIEYDQDIPKFLRKYGKKWGATVGEARTTEGYDVWSMDITDAMKQSVLYEGQPMYSISDENQSIAPNPNEKYLVDRSTRLPLEENSIAPIGSDIVDSNKMVQDVPVQETEEMFDAPGEEGSLTKLEAIQTEIENLTDLRKEAYTNYDRSILQLQAEYDAKKNKDTKVAQKLLMRIERTKGLRDSTDADYSKRISTLEKREKLVREGKPTTREELHNGLMNNVRNTFKKNGLDYDEVLKGAKNLSTFSTVDNTPQRVMEKALGYKAGQVLSDLTVNKVAQDESEGIKWLNSFTDKKSGMLKQISDQYHIKPGSKESAAAQMYAEGFYVNDKNEVVAYGDRELAMDFKNTKVQENIKGLASDPRIRQIYDDTLGMINESRTRNSYPEIPRLDNYFLHFRAMDDTFSKLGLPFNPNDIRAKDLPTDLNGVTADLKPGQPYFSSAMHRTGQRTSFDLLGGLERYLTSAKNQIYHIDNIQTLRAIRNDIANTYGQAQGLENLDSLSEEEVQERIEKVYNSHLSTFAKFLNEEANILAGKTALIDRGLEGIIGRRALTFMNTLNRQVGSNMVGFSNSSALVNIDALPRAFAKTNKFDFVKGFAQFTSNKIGSVFGRNDGFAEQSPVMIRRKGAERFYRTPWQKVGDAGYVLMGAVDNAATEIIARTKYNELVRKGMDSQQAHFETDKWVSRLMGDRSLGQMPQLFNSKTLGLITKFQLEVRNNLDSMFYDTIQESKVSSEHIQNALAKNTRTAAKVTSTLVQLAVGQHLFGKAMESVVGYNPAFDIISVMMTALGFDDEEESEDTALDNIEQGFLELLEDLPYSSTFTGGRIPISAALPVKELVTGKDDYGSDKSRWETLGEVAPYYVLPGGYGQIKKTYQGLSMFDDDLPVSGSYTDSGKMRFPVEDTLENRVRAGLFGQYANENAREYFDRGESPLNEKRIEEYKELDLPISEYWDYRDGLKGKEKLEEKLDYINELDLPIDKKNIMAKNNTDRKEAIDMSVYASMTSLEEYDEYIKNKEKIDELGFSSGQFTEYVGLKNDISDIEKRIDKKRELASDDDELSELSTQKKEEITDLIISSNLTEEQKAFVYDKYYSGEEKINMALGLGIDFTTYIKYAQTEFRADKDANGKTISGSAKEKKVNYINNLDLDYGQKIILFRMSYSSKKDKEAYNRDILDYLNSRDDLSFDEIRTILEELDFKVYDDGRVEW